MNVKLENIDCFQFIRFRMLEDGSVWYRNAKRNWEPFPNEDKSLCLDGIQNYVENLTQPYNNTVDENLIVMCLPPVEEVSLTQWAQGSYKDYIEGLPHNLGTKTSKYVLWSVQYRLFHLSFIHRHS